MPLENYQNKSGYGTKTLFLASIRFWNEQIEVSFTLVLDIEKKHDMK